MVDKEIILEWFDKGNNDLRSAEYLATMHHPTPDEVICYLCQQSAEKYLKGFIVSKDIEPEKTHNLEELLEECNKYKAEFSTLLSKANILNRYSVMPRYPNKLNITEEDMKNAITYAKAIQTFVLNIFSQPSTDDQQVDSENQCPANLQKSQNQVTTS